jgi:hypothetical protein
MSENELDVQYRFFVVGGRPLCVWGTDIQSLALELLDNLDASYFEYLANTHSQHINEDQPREKETQFAALAIRSAYSQAIETMFALLCAAVQAPQCVHAWIDNYQPRELYALVRKIHGRQLVDSLLSAKRVTWQTIAEAVFESLVLEDKEKESAINYPAASGRGIGPLEQLELLDMESPIVFFLPWVLDILPDHLFRCMLPNGAHMIAIRPKFTTPQLLLDGWHSSKDFSCR